ncbi:ammonium transporter [Candidatus Poribacteria bacterium]|jgi:ammonium transporter, Amt family|nr:ammonium transporter [Candidatus Poribacteria bacterium]MBT5537108.1 ammonium transporter [Candidatus Poribacteria bacterium]MBT5711440.1 ammonium transporter [Candidatus Poribacteria bacterium]MBT7806901.1 ammonium transporter [Candidatus Poribacteria bacterium]
MKSLPRGARALAISFVGLALVLAAVSGPAQAQEAEVSESVRNYVNEALQGDGDHSFNDYLWMMVAGFLVFFMQAGFAMVEAGFTRAKNAVNILMKNFMDFSAGSLLFWAVGFGLMYGTSKGGWIGTSNFFLSDAVAGGTINNWSYAEWFFQAVFAATAATIVSGAMAERTNFRAYLIYSVFITAFIYPIQGHWTWQGDGFLTQLGFHDFAGSTVVHSVGGWAALVGAIILGPRIGKFGSDGRARVIPGHNIVLAALGVFILWLGWFGFNPGSTLGADVSFARIAVTTNLAAAAGGVGAMFFAWMKVKKPDIGLTLNGVLSGLVAITAGCAVVSPGSAVIIGLVAGVLCVLFVEWVEKVFRVDDPVGAFTVHGVNGVWGTLAVGLFAQNPYAAGSTSEGLFFGGGLSQLMPQVYGVLVVAAWTIITSGLVFGGLRLAGILRVTAEEEREGLDMGEHGSSAYHNEERAF